MSTIFCGRFPPVHSARRRQLSPGWRTDLTPPPSSLAVAAFFNAIDKSHGKGQTGVFTVPLSLLTACFRTPAVEFSLVKLDEATPRGKKKEEFKCPVNVLLRSFSPSL